MELMRRHGEGYHFVGDPVSGVTYRWGNSFAENPASAPWPELADISISNYCTNGCEYCYRSSNEQGGFLSLEDYRFILSQLTSSEHGPVFQVALGGGEPLLHPDIVEILRTTREDYGIIPNYTTSGFFFTPESLTATQKYCGAVAISYDPYRKEMTPEKLQELASALTKAGVKANVHYVVSDMTIDDAVDILAGKRDEIFRLFNAVIFLTYKPFGNGDANQCLRPDERLQSFLRLVEKPETDLQFGFDACFVPFLLRKTKVNFDLLDSCECGFFSVYVDEQLRVSPCSFCSDEVYRFDLRQVDFATIWNEKFQKYKDKVSHNCTADCSAATMCRGCCPFFKELFICPSL